MCLRFVFLLALCVAAWLRPSRRSSAWKDAEILLLRHRIALLERRGAVRQKLIWTDRAWLPATPATILRRHRGPVKRRWAAKSRLKSPGGPRRYPTVTR